MGADPERLSITVNPHLAVSGLLLVPDSPKAAFVLAHGAGAGMTHHFLADAATGLHARGLATLRYQFPYMERGSRRPDTPALAHATVRAAARRANERLPDIPLFAGGKSFGGRMTSQAQAEAPLPNVQGLAFLGFPLHPAGKPAMERAHHLFDVRVPMLFLQGTRDALADPPLIERLAKELGKRAALVLFPDADHSFHVPARSGRTDQQMLAEVLDALAGWIFRTTR